MIKNQRTTGDTHTSSGISAKALLSTVTRIVSDNERLHTESVDKVLIEFIIPVLDDCLVFIYLVLIQ
jgi:hypothetical protein